MSKSNSYKPLTDYIEANALLALQDGEPEAAREMLRELTLPGLDRVARAAHELFWLCRELAREETTRVVEQATQLDREGGLQA